MLGAEIFSVAQARAQTSCDAFQINWDEAKLLDNPAAVRMHIMPTGCWMERGNKQAVHVQLVCVEWASPAVRDALTNFKNCRNSDLAWEPWTNTEDKVKAMTAKEHSEDFSLPDYRLAPQAENLQFYLL